jgi:hypothetical protein
MIGIRFSGGFMAVAGILLQEFGSIFTPAKIEQTYYTLSVRRSQ